MTQPGANVRIGVYDRNTRALLRELERDADGRFVFTELAANEMLVGCRPDGTVLPPPELGMMALNWHDESYGWKMPSGQPDRKASS